MVSKTTRIRIKACAKFRKDFLEKHDYMFCESCGENETFPQVCPHHIMYCSRYPKHKELHNPLNLIMLCLKCHTAFHGGRRKEEHKELVEERGLRKLFKLED
jgi:hypothetical protein